MDTSTSLERHEERVPDVAAAWERWCGETPWSRELRTFGRLGGRMVWWGGYPRSASAIPLCFSLYTPDGLPITGGSRLKDIRRAVALLRERQDSEEGGKGSPSPPGSNARPSGPTAKVKAVSTSSPNISTLTTHESH